MIKNIINFLQDEEGATMVEYAIMVGLIAAVCVGVVTTLGTKTQGTFTTTGNVMP